MHMHGTMIMSMIMNDRVRGTLRKFQSI